MVTKRDHGIHLDRTSPQERAKLISYINIKLRSLGLPSIQKRARASVLARCRDCSICLRTTALTSPTESLRR